MPKFSKQIPQKKENMDPIVDTPVADSSAVIDAPAAVTINQVQEDRVIGYPDAVEIGDPTPEDPAMDALRSKIEAEIRAKIALENAKKVDPGFIKPGVRSPYQEAISQTQVHHGNTPLDGQQAEPARVYEVSAGTIRQDY